MAQGIALKSKNFTTAERDLYDDGWKQHAFNNFFSTLIPLNRSLPDVRLPSCRNETYASDLPTVTIVMCFHNEAWTVLLRGVFSILNRSPPALLKEILLVDDYSDMDHLGEPLDIYVNETFGGKVRVLRNNKREGLVRSRLFGARVSTGDVLIFLDSHIEVTDGWLEPLLHEIKKNESTVVAPMIDIIDKETFEYKFAINSRVGVGGFDWNLHFNWHTLPVAQQRARTSDHSPVKTPTMAGGLFAISKKYFEYLGTYDAGMDIWGGENLEMSFRIWMCG